MDLVINKKLINEKIPVILDTIRRETGFKFFKQVKPGNSDNYSCTCPFHKDGQENHPSCQVFAGDHSAETEYGYFHCFTCGTNAHLYEAVGYCFGESAEFGKEWLVERFGNTFVQYVDTLTDIIIDKPKEEFLDESILNQYAYYHPYMWQRKLSKEVVDKFKVGYNQKTNCIVFPIWDERGNLKMTTERSVVSKNFYIQEDIDKPVYLLNYIIKEHHTTCYVVESQINALTLWSWGLPAVALIGTGSSKQYPKLNKSGVRNFILAFDGDEAGDRGIERFKRNIRDDVMVSVVKIPRGKDVNDLTEEEFRNLKII